jgi:SAM-dependent methyltransferase
MGDAEHHYRGDAGREYHSVKRGIPDAAYSWVARLRAAKFAGDVGPEDIVFEYGVGAGWNLALLPCRRRLGYDVAEFLATSVKARGIEWVPEPAALGDATVDVAICHHTLEHVLAPSTVLKEIRRWLRPGGKLWLSVPFEKERVYRRYRASEPNHHLYSWNVQTLGNLVKECGFETSKAGLGRFGYDRLASVLACRFGLGEKGYRLIHATLHLMRPGLEVRVVASKQG